ncbi:hypothetical protein [Rossellomorea aquimaris]|uniref:hypothetical protein n=1 Tax=Rossellomorea aquimaris TaxID=189382 RepID=UPI0011E8E020|nr:hypothetical protein [Rossellomorea aquimaris]TYS87514.1 hypothetical protein FZC88_16090 [Rossellomorea aquimaris]
MESTYKSGNINNFKHLSQFSDIKDFNNHFEQWMLDVKKEFTKSELVALKRLVRFSAKVFGVCNAKIGTLTKATHELDGPGISRSTFKRMVTKAKQFGLLTVHETERKNGSKSSNVYVFNSYSTGSEPSEVDKLNQPQTDNLSKTINHIKDIRTDDEINQVTNENYIQQSANEKLGASFVGEHVPSNFTKFVKCFFDDAKTIEEYWKIVQISASKHNVTSDVVETSIQAFKMLIRRMKLGRVCNPFGFYWGILNKKLRTVSLMEAFNTLWEK